MQTEYFGNGALDNLKSVIANHSPSKVFVVTGGKSYRQSGAESIIDTTLKGINTFRYFGFEENPKIEDLLEGASLINDFDPDLIIAVGGGSVIDTAKIISVLPDKADEATNMIKGDYLQLNKLAPIVAIPTTSGSGSEATHFAVAYIQSIKYSVAHSDILPDYSIIDPTLTYSMSPYQTAVSGLDALSQAIESGWANGTTELSKKYSLEAIDLILDNIKNAVHNPCPDSRLKMAKGSNLAGKAINISKTTAPHAMSYGLTSKYQIPHGHAVAVTLGHFFVLNKKLALVQENIELDKYMNQLVQKFGTNDVELAKNRFYGLVESLGLKLRLKEIGLHDEEDLDDLVKSVNVERLQNHPIKLDKNMLLEILKKAL
ncbi:phosphonoacetaldehyde reductase [Balneola vulgaris]|uniref:phosphonoacetaldehyde reductase n=1 Tax=Balneola vulgaris TaxID=287535 RepID=UPI00037AAD7C|nr:phosphonoacetaldehyde reductase [Balneola vulgaris]